MVDLYFSENFSTLLTRTCAAFCTLIELDSRLYIIYISQKGKIKKEDTIMDPLYGCFQSVAGQDGQIDSNELQRCLTSSGITGNYQPFSKECCRIMICMLDRDYSGKMGFNEFQELWTALNMWKNIFMQYDRDGSGTIEHHELHQAISSWGYNLTPQALNIIVQRYTVTGRIKFDDFVSCAIRLRMLTDAFRRHDVTQTGHANFQYDLFIQTTMFS